MSKNVFKGVGLQSNQIIDCAFNNIYTAPVTSPIATSSILQSILITNMTPNAAYTSAQIVTVTVDILDNGNYYKILYNAEIAPGNTLTFERTINLNPGAILRVYSHSNQIDIYASIMEITQ